MLPTYCYLERVKPRFDKINVQKRGSDATSRCHLERVPPCFGKIFAKMCESATGNVIKIFAVYAPNVQMVKT